MAQAAVSRTVAEPGADAPLAELHRLQELLEEELSDALVRAPQQERRQQQALPADPTLGGHGDDAAADNDPLLLRAVLRVLEGAGEAAEAVLGIAGQPAGWESVVVGGGEALAAGEDSRGSKTAPWRWNVQSVIISKLLPPHDDNGGGPPPQEQPEQPAASCHLLVFNKGGHPEPLSPAMEKGMRAVRWKDYGLALTGVVGPAAAAAAAMMMAASNREQAPPPQLLPTGHALLALAPQTCVPEVAQQQGDAVQLKLIVLHVTCERMAAPAAGAGGQHAGGIAVQQQQAMAGAVDAQAAIAADAGDHATAIEAAGAQPPHAPAAGVMPPPPPPPSARQQAHLVRSALRAALDRQKAQCGSPTAFRDKLQQRLAAVVMPLCLALTGIIRNATQPGVAERCCKPLLSNSNGEADDEAMAACYDELPWRLEAAMLHAVANEQQRAAAAAAEKRNNKRKQADTDNGGDMDADAAAEAVATAGAGAGAGPGGYDGGPGMQQQEGNNNAIDAVLLLEAISPDFAAAAGQPDLFGATYHHYGGAQGAEDGGDLSIGQMMRRQRMRMHDASALLTDDGNQQQPYDAASGMELDISNWQHQVALLPPTAAGSDDYNAPHHYPQEPCAPLQLMPMLGSASSQQAQQRYAALPGLGVPFPAAPRPPLLLPPSGAAPVAGAPSLASCATVQQQQQQQPNIRQISITERVMARLAVPPPAPLLQLEQQQQQQQGGRLAAADAAAAATATFGSSGSLLHLGSAAHAYASQQAHQQAASQVALLRSSARQYAAATMSAAAAAEAAEDDDARCATGVGLEPPAHCWLF